MTVQLPLKADNALFQTVWGAPMLDLVVLTRKNLTDLKGHVGFQSP